MELLRTGGVPVQVQLATGPAVQIQAVVQPMSAAEAVAAGQQPTTVLYRCLADSWPAGPATSVTWSGRTWDVVGEPLRRNELGAVRHIKVILRARTDLTVRVVITRPGPGETWDPDTATTIPTAGSTVYDGPAQPFTLTSTPSTTLPHIFAVVIPAGTNAVRPRDLIAFPDGGDPRLAGRTARPLIVTDVRRSAAPEVIPAEQVLTCADPDT